MKSRMAALLSISLMLTSCGNIATGRSQQEEVQEDSVISTAESKTEQLQAEESSISVPEESLDPVVVLFRNGTDNIVMENLYYDYPVIGAKPPLAPSLLPGEQLELDQLADHPAVRKSLAFTAKLLNEPDEYLVRLPPFSAKTNEIVLLDEDQLKFQITGWSDTDIEYTKTIIFNPYYQAWVDKSYGSLFYADVRDARLLEIYPNRPPNPVWGGATVIHCYEDVYDLKILYPEHIMYEDLETKKSLEIRSVSHVTDVFTTEDVLLCNPDHWRDINFFLQYYDKDGVEYRWYFKEGGSGWGAHYDGFIDMNIELIFTEDTVYENFEGNYIK